MSNSEYWIKTALIREIQMQQRCTYTISEIEKLYNNAIRDINAEIAKIFETFKNGVSITTEEARELINSAKNEEISKRLQEILKQTEDEKQRAELIKKIHAQAYGARISRLEAVKLNIYSYFKEKANIEIKKAKTLYDTVIEESYYRTVHDIAKGCNVGINFSLIPQKAIDEILSDKWHGSQFSDKVWKNSSLAAEKAQEIIARGLLSHQSYNKMADELVEVCKNTKYNARRLVRTQANHFLNLSEFKAYEDLGIEEYKYLATLDYKTCELCQPLDGKIFLLSEKIEGVNFPTIHPHCRCTTTMPTEYARRWARDPATGKGYKINDMTYSEWIESLDDEQKAAFEKNVKMYKNRGSDKKQYEEYINVLGKENMPKTFDLFQDLKYNDISRWEDLRGFYRYKGENPSAEYKHYAIYTDLKNNGINKGIILPVDNVKAYILADETAKRDKYHIMNRMKERDITDDEIRSYKDNALIMFSQWNNTRRTYYSTEGVCAVTKNPEQWVYKTAWKREDFDDDVLKTLEVVKKYE